VGNVRDWGETGVEGTGVTKGGLSCNNDLEPTAGKGLNIKEPIWEKGGGGTQLDLGPRGGRKRGDYRNKGKTLLVKEGLVSPNKGEEKKTGEGVKRGGARGESSRHPRERDSHGQK